MKKATVRKLILIAALHGGSSLYTGSAVAETVNFQRSGSTWYDDDVSTYFESDGSIYENNRQSWGQDIDTWHGNDDSISSQYGNSLYHENDANIRAYPTR